LSRSLDKFVRVTANPYSSLSQWKARTNGKIFGCVPMHIPEEIVHAAGLLPVVLWEGDEPFDEGHAIIQPFFCGFVRGVIDLAVKGKLHFLDGIICCDECVSTEAIDFLLRRRGLFDYFEFLFLPADRKGDTSKVYVMEEFERLRASLAQYTGKEIDDASLEQSIRLYNRNRSLLRKLYGLRREKPTVLKAREMYAIVMSSMLMPKEEHNELLEALISELAAKEAIDGKVRLFLSGTLCAAPRSEVLDLIEDTGGAIVDDDLYVGSRYFEGDVPLHADPIESLAERYVNLSLRTPTLVDHEHDWGHQLVEMVNRSGSQALIALPLKNCDPHQLHYPRVRQKLARAGVPEFFIEMEHEAMSLGQIRTRIQAFMEMIGGR